MNQELFSVGNTKYDGIYRGVVQNNVDPDNAGKCQIQIYPMFQGIATANLPWAYPAQPVMFGAGANYGIMNIPHNGSHVYCMFLEGDVYQPIYCFEAPTLTLGKLTQNTTADYPHIRGWLSPNGSYQNLDDKTGDFTLNTIRDWIANVGRNLTFTVVGNATTVAVNAIFTISSNFTANIMNNLTMTVTNLASITDLTGQKLAQSGMMIDYAGSTAPNGWLLCYGQAISRTTYAQLFSVIGITYGAGNGTTTFNLPDCRGRATLGLDNMGGVDAENLYESQNSMTNNRDTLGGIVGEAAHTQTINELVSHNHNMSQSVQSGSSTECAVGPNGPMSTSYTGGGLPFNVVQPGIMINKIIKI